MCAVAGNKSEKIPYPAYLIGKLAGMVAAENMRQRARIYTLEYYAGKWIWLRYKEFAGGDFYDIVPRDTRVTEANLTMALSAMERAIGEVA